MEGLGQAAAPALESVLSLTTAFLWLFFSSSAIPQLIVFFFGK